MTIARFTLYLTIFLTLAACASSDPDEGPGFSLNIAHINDTHSAFDPVPGRFQARDYEVHNQFGGHPRLAARIDLYREQAAAAQQPFLVLHGGDAWQGSAYFKLNEGRMNADILSRMGIDAMALGNHEFDLNNALLNEFVEQINFPLLAANIDTSQDADLRDQSNLKPYVLFAFDGDQKTRVRAPDLPDDQVIVAVFGLALDDMPNISPNTGDVQFFDMVRSARDTVRELENLGVQHIIAVTHVGHALDLDVARQVNGIDVIVGGHSHTLLGDFRQLDWGDNGTYAQKVYNPNGTTYTCVVQAGEYAQAVGLLELEFNAAGEVSYCEGGNTLLSDDQFYRRANRQDAFDSAQSEHILTFIDNTRGIAVVEEQAALREVIDSQYRPAMEAAYGDMIARVPHTLNHVRQPGERGSSQHGSAVAPIVAQGQYAWAASPEVVALTGLQPDFALVGAGGIRTSIAEGELREGDITLEMLPFASPISVLPLRGSVVREVLQQTIAATLPEGAHAGRYPYGGQLRYEFRETERGVQGELTQLEVNTGTLDTPNWQPLEDEQLYNVVINSYLANANDGWYALFDAQAEDTARVDLAYVDGELRAFPVSHLTQSDGRTQVVYAEATLDCNAQSTACNTDAQAVVEYIRAHHSELQALAEPVVTLIRKD